MDKNLFAKVILVINILFISFISYAQNPLKNRIEAIIEDIIVDNDVNNTDWEELLIRWEELSENPYDLNCVSREQLADFPFLSDSQIENILAYIYMNGPMESIYELQLIEDMDYKTIRYLEPFVCVKPVNNSVDFHWKDLWKYGKNELTARLDIPCYTRKGYSTSYLGPSVYQSVRYSYRYREQVYMGFTGEKDAGEPFGALHNTKGYDFYSYYLLIKDWGRLKKLALGNYRLGFGQGLVISNDFSLGKNAYTGTFDFRSSGIKKHSSTDEYNYFRGAAAEIRLTSRLDMALFYSNRLLDGSVDESGTLTSVYTSGLHRSESEVKKIGQVRMQVAGGRMAYMFDWLKLGITGLYYGLDRDYIPLERTYNQFYIRGSQFYNLGFDYSLRWHGIGIQGELAKGKEGWASLTKLFYSWRNDYRFSLIYRYYAHDYWAWFARSFGEGGSVQNENGWYFSVELTPLSYWRFFIYADFFSFPWMKYRISKPSWGSDILFQADYEPSERWLFSGSYRFKRKERDLTGSGGSITPPTWQHRFRLRGSYSPADGWLLKTQAYFTRFSVKKYSNSNGFLVSQAVSWKPVRFPLQGDFQVNYFLTDDYDSRVYCSEKGLLYSFYTPSFQGEGMRTILQLRYDMNKYLMFLLKFGETFYFDRQSIGSGNDLIASNRKADFQLQLRVKF